MHNKKKIVIEAIAQICRFFAVTNLFLDSKNKSVSIFLFHRICCHESMGVTLHVFEEIIKSIQRSFCVLTMDEACKFLANKNSRNSNKRYAVITFDDGYLDNYTDALPVLQKRGVPATLFACTGFIDSGYSNWEMLDAALLRRKEDVLDLRSLDLGVHIFSTDEERSKVITKIHGFLKVKPINEMELAMAQLISDSPAVSVMERSMMNWEELRSFAETPGMTIGAHTVTHPNLTLVSEADLLKELIQSKLILEERLGVSVRHFAYPSGFTSPEVVQAARKTGFTSACLVQDGVNTKGCDLFALRRRSVIQDCCVGSTGEYSDAVFLLFASGFRQAIGDFFRSNRFGRSTGKNRK